MRFFAEEFFDSLNDLGHSGHPTDEDHFIDGAGGNAGVGQGSFAGFDGSGNQVINQLFKFGSSEFQHQMLRSAGIGRDKGQVDFRFLRRGQFDFGSFCGFLQPLERHAVVFQVNALVFLEFIHQPINDAKVKVVAA